MRARRALGGALAAWLKGRRWFGAKGRSIDKIELDEAFVLDASSHHVLALTTVVLEDRSRQAYTMGLTGAPLRSAEPGDGVWRALAVAMAEGRTIPSLPVRDDPRLPPTAALVCRPAAALADLASPCC